MLLVLSPAKALNFDPAPLALEATTPVLSDETAKLARVTRKLSVRSLKKMMGLSDDLAQLNHARFQTLGGADAQGLAAVFAFNGDVYRGLNARELDAPALAYAQAHLRILSGLYGVLRPSDAIEPYRLEMGVSLKTARGRSLYAFWGDRIAKALDEAANGETIINLASQEYFTAAHRPALKSPVITCHFREEKDGELKLVSFFAKRARGLMARFAIDGRLTEPEALKAFGVEGYGFRPQASTPTDWVFARPAQAPKR